MSTSLSRNSNFWPRARVVEVPKLRRMSLRTMPDSARALGPLEPSPGYGPAVSVGISATVAAAAVPVPALRSTAPPTVAAPAPDQTEERPAVAGVLEVVGQPAVMVLELAVVGVVVIAHGGSPPSVTGLTPSAGCGPPVRGT